MRLITLNTWGKCGPYQERWRFLLEELGNLKPDVLCLQEVMDDELTRSLQKFLGFSNFIPSYEAGLLILSRFPLSDHRILSYQHRSPQEMDYKRNAITTKIKIGKIELVLANTHLAWREEDRPTRDGQITELLEAIKETCFPSIICGDLNDIPESLPLERTRTSGYENLLQIYQPDAITWDNRNLFIQTHNVKFPDRQIDYILTHESASRILKPKTCRRAFDQINEQLIYPSDHYGIFSEFKIS